MIDYYNKTFKARYHDFSVGDASSNYMLKVGPFDDPHSTLADGMTQQNDMMFSTYDAGHYRRRGTRCSEEYGKGGWWYHDCYKVNPNGLNVPNAEYSGGLHWRYKAFKASEFAITKTSN